MSTDDSLEQIVRREVLRYTGDQTASRESHGTLISASDVQNLPSDGRVVVPPGVLITPLARQLARERGISVVSGAVESPPVSRETGTSAAAPAWQSIAALIDHTLLKADATPSEIERLCSEAQKYHFASVCVNPVNVKQCASILRGSQVAVCTVVAFPLGATPTGVKVFEADAAMEDGAAEVDMVINIGALKAGNDRLVQDDITYVAQACHSKGSLLKVIIETALLTEEQKVRACLLAKAAGADFVKTSTGFGPAGATASDVALMRKTVGTEMGVKAAGGIRTAADARKMIEAGANRIGASASVAIVETEGRRPYSRELNSGGASVATVETEGRRPYLRELNGGGARPGDIIY